MSTFTLQCVISFLTSTTKKLFGRMSIHQLSLYGKKIDILPKKSGSRRGRVNDSCEPSSPLLVWNPFMLPCDLSNTCPRWVSSSHGSSPTPSSGVPFSSPCWGVSHLASLAWGVHAPEGGRREALRTGWTAGYYGKTHIKHVWHEGIMFYKKTFVFVFAEW